MASAVRHLSGRQPALYHGDHANPAQPRVRSLKEEIARVVRSRVTNPKWMDGAKRHGYKGAFEMAATVDYLDRKSTRLNSSHLVISYAVFCLKKKKKSELHTHVYS